MSPEEVIPWLTQNWATLSTAVLMLLGAAEAATRLTATKTDDGWVQRVGNRIRQVGGAAKAALDALKVPNRRKGGGQHPK